MNIKQAKAIPLEDVLARLGHAPVRQGRNQLWYCSPLRNESNPSFKVNPAENVWFDFGAGEGGDAIDLVQRVENLNKVSEALARLDQLLAGHVPPPRSAPRPAAQAAPALELLRTGPVHARSLRTYLNQRGIEPALAAGNIKEVHYRVDDKEYFALGLANDSGGFELRNPFWKGSLGRKDITTIPGDPDRVSVYEGMFDYLTAVQLAGGKLEETAIVLNSVSLADRAIARIRKIGTRSVQLYRDRDAAGEALMTKLQEGLPGIQINDASVHYSQFNDLNAWHVATKRDDIVPVRG
jgi:5S rRNA maturation endonuclease (ribonuclease M5)